MRRLHGLVMACALLTGGCVLPCGGGACSAKGRLWEPPIPRFNQTETPIFASSKQVCPTGYPTFAKYWPGMDEWSTNHTAKSAARRTLWLQQLQSFRFYSADFKDGFTQAYVDIANGASGECPPIPPPRYWNSFYRSQCGEKYADQWFNGYRAGAAMANVQLASMRKVHASYDWQMPERKKFAGSEQCAQSACQSGQCHAPGLGQPAPSNFVCQPGMGMMGDSPTVTLGPQYAPGSPIPNFDPQFGAPGQPQPSFGNAPGFGPIPDPAMSPSGPPGGVPSGIVPSPAQRPQLAPSPAPIGPGHSSGAVFPNAAPSPGINPGSNLPVPGHSSGSGAGSPSSLPSEPLVY